MNILDNIIESTKARVEREKAKISFNEMRSKAESLYQNQLKSLESSADSSLRDFATQNRGNPNQESLIKKKNK